jgi:hypothetical protein
MQASLCDSMCSNNNTIKGPWTEGLPPVTDSQQVFMFSSVKTVSIPEGKVTEQRFGMDAVVDGPVLMAIWDDTRSVPTYVSTSEALRGST